MILDSANNNVLLFEIHTGKIFFLRAPSAGRSECSAWSRVDYRSALVVLIRISDSGLRTFHEGG